MKLKTHKATQKRIKIIKSGKILRVKAAKSHLLSQKSDPTKTKLEISKSDVGHIRKLMPNK